MSHKIFSNYIQNGKCFMSNKTSCVVKCSDVGGLSSIKCEINFHLTITNVSNSPTIRGYTRISNIKGLRHILNYFLISRNMSTSRTALKDNNTNKIINKRHAYKKLDVEKLLSGMGNKSKEVFPKKEQKALSKQHQLQQAIEEAARKLKTDWSKKVKNAFRYHVFTISVMILILVPSNIFYCWYDPVHRERASKISPNWGKFIDKILDPLNDDIKQNAGIPVSRADKLENSEFLKNSAISFKESIEKNLGHEKIDKTLNSEGGE